MLNKINLVKILIILIAVSGILSGCGLKGARSRPPSDKIYTYPSKI